MKNIPENKIRDFAQYLQAVVRMDDNTRIDGNDAIYFARELLNVRATAFDFQYAELEALTHLPVKMDIDPAQTQYTYQTFQGVGTATLVSSYSKTGPRADLLATEAAPMSIRGMTSSYGYSFQEMRESKFAGKNIDVRKAEAARRSIAQLTDTVMAFGSSFAGVAMPGLLTLSGTQTYTVPAGDSGSTTWAKKTPDEVLFDMYNMESQVVINSNNVERPDTLLLPQSSFEMIKQRRVGDGSNDSILTQFLRNSTSIKNVQGWYLLEAAPASQWTGRRMMAYKKDPMKLEAILPVPFEQLPPQLNGFETVIQCHGRIAGVCLYFPQSVIYGDGI